MSKITKMSYTDDNGAWTGPYDIGAKAENVDVSIDGGTTKKALSTILGTITSSDSPIYTNLNDKVSKTKAQSTTSELAGSITDEAVVLNMTTPEGTITSVDSSDLSFESGDTFSVMGGKYNAFQSLVGQTFSEIGSKKQSMGCSVDIGTNVVANTWFTAGTLTLTPGRYLIIGVVKPKTSATTTVYHQLITSTENVTYTVGINEPFGCTTQLGAAVQGTFYIEVSAETNIAYQFKVSTSSKIRAYAYPIKLGEYVE